MHSGHADDQHGRVQPQPLQADGAYKRACGPVPGEPGERELVYADVQQRVHRIRELLVFGRSAFRCISSLPILLIRRDLPCAASPVLAQ